MRRSIKLKEALFWVVLAGVAAHTSLFLVKETTEAFFESSVSKVTRTLEKV